MEYFVRLLKANDYMEPGVKYGDIDGDGDISFMNILLELYTKKGKIKVSRMIDFDKDLAIATKADLENLKVVGGSEYFRICETDPGQEHPYRDFGFIIHFDGKVEIQEHSSENRVPNFLILRI